MTEIGGLTGMYEGERWLTDCTLEVVRVLLNFEEVVEVTNLEPEYADQAYLLPPRPTWTLATDKFKRASPFFSKSFGAQFESSRLLSSTSVSLSCWRSSMCRSINADITFVESIECNLRCQSG